MLKPIRVLFVDDSEDDVWLLLNELKKADYKPEYERVFTPQTLEDALKQQEWDVIICDYRMPRFNAPTALRILHDSGLDIPFIVVSGAMVEETGVAVMRSGAHDYIMKDNLGRLVPVIERETMEAANRRERLKAEKRALWLGQILDNSSNEIYVFQFNQKFIQVNRSAVKNLGYNPEELVGLSLLDIQPELTLRQLNGYINALQNGDKDEISFEAFHQRKNGSTYPVEVRLYLSRSETPPVFIAIVRDITERKESEKAIKVTLDRITDLYRISRSVGSMRTIEDILISLLDSHYLNVSEALVLLFETHWDDTPPEYYEISTRVSAGKSETKGERCPMNTYPLVGLLSSDQPVFIADVSNEPRLSQEARAELAKSGITSLMLFPMKNSTSWYGLLALHFKENRDWNQNDRRHIEGLVDQVLIAMDNVLLLASEAQARKEAEKANQLKLQFLAMISHELRTPLTSIKGFSTTLLADDTTWEEHMQREFLSIIDEETDKLTGLIDQLLDLSRLQAGTLSISPVYENFSSVLDSAMMHLRILTQQHQLYIHTPPQLPILSLDTERIAQVIENLVQNAVKYSAADTRITLSVNTKLDSLQVDVTDEGIGIPLEERDHIFDAFHQVKRNKSARGAGLGLAICKGLIEAHGGKIWVQKTSEAGTTISFSLPVPPVPAH